MGRLILFDKRGTGLSDRVSPERLPDLETRMDDVRAVLDAVGSERAVVLGISEGGAMSALFAATHPARTVALVLMGTFARMMRAPDYPIGVSDDDYRERLAVTDEDDWASATTKEWLGRVGPDILRDPAAVRWYTSYLRRGASPGANKAMRIMNAEIDVRDFLPTISVPTLVLYRSDEYLPTRPRGSWASTSPGRRWSSCPATDHLPWEGDQESVLDEIERFLAGVHDDVEPDRVLATLLFTDIVGVDRDGGRLGDRAWNELLTRHHRLVRAQLARFRGREVDTAGDGAVRDLRRPGPRRPLRLGDRRLGPRPRRRGASRRPHRARSSSRTRACAASPSTSARASPRPPSPGEVLVSSTVKDIVAGSGIGFEERGEHELAGVPGTWRLFAAAP